MLVAKGQGRQMRIRGFILSNTMANGVHLCSLKFNRVSPYCLVFPGTRTPKYEGAAEDLAAQIRYIILTKSSQQGHCLPGRESHGGK